MGYKIAVEKGDKESADKRLEDQTDDRFQSGKGAKKGKGVNDYLKKVAANGAKLRSASQPDPPDDQK